MNEMSPLNFCFPNNITKHKLEDYIKTYEIEGKDLDKLLISLYKRGYTLPQPFMSKALSLCCFGSGDI